ncbi:hypothetical protein [Mesorhizobium sp. Root102]|uniref:hypothetical protein n=1 Tax=Mesorhizobium sp. Root102 TaxID=1736422 RepID=UPI0006FC4FB6|nr:hypothetical protein [Mesorhizobium sp. Root102]
MSDCEISFDLMAATCGSIAIPDEAARGDGLPPLLQNNRSGWTRDAFGVSRSWRCIGAFYKDFSAIHLREVRMAVFQMVMRGREA